MTLTRETVKVLLAECGSPDCLTCEYATALLAAWDERDRVAAINVDHCRAVNTLLIDGSRWQDRAEAAEAKLADRDAENARLRGRLAETESALSDIAMRTGPYLTAMGCAEDALAALNKEPKP